MKPSAASCCGTKGCPNPPTEKVPDAKLPHVVYDLCASCAAGMRALAGVELIDARNVPPLTFEPLAAVNREPSVQAVGVCGFPRSGSSMTMRMLHAGGIPPVTGSSPISYELAGGLDQLASLPPEFFSGRAVKLLDYPQWFSELPARVEWRFIWLDRDPREQAKSNVKFMGLVMPGLVAGDRGAVRRLAKSYRDDRPRLLAWYRNRGDVLVSSFEAILADPAAEAARICEFLPTLAHAAVAAVPSSRSAACAPDLSFEMAGLSRG